MVELIKQDLNNNKKIYQNIEKKLRTKIPRNVPITHVGSTAIPNMYGKNIIDILIGAKDKEQFEKIAKKIIECGFFSSNNSKTDFYQFFASKKEETGSGDIHIHLVIESTNRYIDFIILKKYLLANKEEALAYSNYKKQIISQGIIERKEYKSLKSEYVTKLLERARNYFK